MTLSRLNNSKLELDKKIQLKQSNSGKSSELEPLSFNSKDSSNVSDLQAKVSELQTRKEEKSASVDEKQSTAEAMQSEVDELQSSSESAQQTAESAQQTAQSAQQTAQAAQANATSLAQSAQAAQANAASLASVAASTPQTIQQEVVGEDGKKTTQEVPNPAYQAAQQAAQAAQAVADEAQAAADEAQSAADEAQANADEAQTAAEEAQTAADEAKTQLESKQQELESGNTELEEIKSEVQQIESDLASAQQELEQAQNANTSAMNNMNDETSSDSEILSEVEAAKEEYKQEDFGTYDEWVKKLQAAGINTTGLASGETNFAEYGAALSDELKQELINSFDTPEDYELQQKLAGLYTGRSNMTTDEFISSCQAMGLNVSSDWVSTSYLVDAKATGGGQAGLNENGAISVLTIVDPSTGAEIKIADTNGNGAIEVEELFMNELLTGISTQIDTSNFKAAVKGASASSASEARAEGREAAEKYNSLMEKDKQDNKTDGSRDTITIADKMQMVDKLKEQFVQAGDSVQVASNKASKIIESNYEVSSDAEKMTSDSIQSAVSKLSKEK